MFGKFKAEYVALLQKTEIQAVLLLAEKVAAAADDVETAANAKVY